MHICERMQHPVYEWLLSNQLAPEAEVDSLQKARANRAFSLFREVSFLLYAGILVLCGGLGTFVYRHIDSIGHMALIALIFIASLLCLGLSHRKYDRYTKSKLWPPSLVFPYVVLLGVSLFLLWEGYIEYQYGLFDGYYALPSLVAALLCFVAAYRFDHEGVLSIALASLAATVGLSILPQKWFLGQVEYNLSLFMAGVCMGAFMVLAGYGLARKELKIHFENIWAVVGGFLLLIGAIGLQYNGNQGHWLVFLILPVCFGLYVYARRLKSIGLYITLIFAAYLSSTGFLFHITSGDFWIFATYYGMVSFAGIGYLLVRYKHFLKITQ